VGKLLARTALKQRCQKLGVDTTEVAYGSGHRVEAGDEELQRRVIDAEISARERNVWILALLSAIASVLSAAAALWAALLRK
jgi:hypothetical protein